jgi:hypothetical protein
MGMGQPGHELTNLARAQRRKQEVESENRREN